MSRKGVQQLLVSFTIALGLGIGMPARAIDAIPLYDVVSISALLSEQYANVGIGTAASVNETDDAAGYAIIDNYYRAFVYTGELGVVVLPGLPGWSSHQALDVTDRIDGMLYIVGLAQSGIYDEPQVGVIWEFDTLSGTATATQVGPVTGGAANSLTDINNQLLALGQSIHLGAKPMLYDHLSGAKQLLDLPSVAADINDVVNDTAMVAGNDWRATLTFAPDGAVTVGAPEFLGGPPSTWWLTISALNANNSVAARTVMTYGDGAGRRMNGAARYTDFEGWRLLWAWSAFDSANGLNDHGDVIGALGAGSAVRSALYIDALNAAYLLEDLIDPDSPYGFVSSVADINNNGTIAAGGGASLLISMGDMPLPTAPANLTAVPHEPFWQQPWNAITLNWENTSNLARNFTIERRINGTQGWSVIREGWSPLSMWDMDVGLGVTYDYRVRAAGLVGLSGASNVATATAPSDPVDTEDPTIVITSPSDGDVVSGRVRIHVEADDNIGVTYMDVDVTGNYYNQRVCSGTGPVLDCNWNARKLENGIYTIQAYASDAMGNGGYSTIQVTIGDDGGGGGGGGGNIFAMQIPEITMRARTKRGNTEVTGTVLVTDGNGDPVRSAMVYGTWTLPSGGTVSRVVYSARNGTAPFKYSDGKGTYLLTVTNVVKSGYTFDPACCTLSASITVN